MASYPFPRTSSFPQSFPFSSKQDEEGSEYSPPLEMPTHQERHPSQTGIARKLALALFTLALIIWLLLRSSTSSSQSDSIPFSRDFNEESVERLSPLLVTNFRI